MMFTAYMLMQAHKSNMEGKCGEVLLLSPASSLIHAQSKTGDLSKLTCHTLVKIKECCQKWINLEGESREIAEIAPQLCQATIVVQL